MLQVITNNIKKDEDLPIIKTKASHPTYQIMIAKAVESRGKEGASRIYIKKYLICNYNISENSIYIRKTIFKLLKAPEGKPRLIADRKRRGTFRNSPELKATIESDEIHVGKTVDPLIINRGKNWDTKEIDLLLSEVEDTIKSVKEVSFEEMDAFYMNTAIVHKRTSLSIKFRLALFVHKKFSKMIKPEGYDCLADYCLYLCSSHLIRKDDYVNFLNRNPKLENQSSILQILLKKGEDLKELEIKSPL